MAFYRLTTTLLLTATCLLMRGVFSIETATTCDGNNVHRLSCDQGVIGIQSGLYGRTNRETCSVGRSPNTLSNTECSQQGAADIIKRRCDGKKSCELTTEEFHTSDPCSGISKYLQTNYTCLPAYYTVQCERGEAHLQCASGQVIFVYGADYGRHDMTTCSARRPERQIENVYCSNPTGIVAERCNGKNNCTIPVLNSVFGDPCVGTYKYLQVAYFCDYV